MRHTRQRAAVLRVLRSSDQHPSAEWIHAEVRKELPRVSLGTIYRLLNSLIAEGNVRLMTTETGPNRYEASPGPHHHVICTGCGQINDVPDLVSPAARQEIERSTGYVITHLRLDWHGLCPACRAAAENDPGL